MKFLQLPEFDIVTSALNFDTPDCHVTGGCDLYTTKAAGSDKKLYKNIDRSLESQHAALLKLGASLSPPHRDSMAPSLNLSRSSPFGPLSEISSRRTFAYLIATLNASHPDYDFSHVLRPADFKRERNLKKVMINIDSTLQSVRPSSSLMHAVSPRGSGLSGVGTGVSGSGGSGGASTAPAWGAHMWNMVNGAMTLDDCTVFSYQPADDPFDEEEGAIWALHYFFFNKARKRVAYLHVRGVPVMSSHSPRLRPLPGARRASGSGELSASLKRRGLDRDDWGATKRARYWLGDRAVERVSPTDDDDDEDNDDGLTWNRDPDGDLRYAESDEYDEYGLSDPDEADEETDETDESGNDSQNAVRGFSEDIAARMELET